jgi:hypothetical protein
VVRVAARVVAEDLLLVLRKCVEDGQDVLDRLVRRVRLLKRCVRLVHVGLVVLVVVEAHGLLVDVRLERAVVIGKRWNLEGHLCSFPCR